MFCGFLFYKINKNIDVWNDKNLKILYLTKMTFRPLYNNYKSVGLDNVIEMSIEDIEYNNEFDAIWASASLLHLKSNKLVDVFNKCYKALKDNGVMYVSFKYGDYEGIIDDRYFTYLNEEIFTNIINQTNFKIDKLWITEDKLNRNVKWLIDVIFKLM